APAGSVSVAGMPVAVPCPVLVTGMSKPMVDPALTGPAGVAVLVTWMVAQLTVTDADEVSVPDVAVVLSVPELVAVVVATRWMTTLFATPGATLARVQVSVWCAGGGLKADRLQPATGAASDQFKPPVLGRVSLTGTLVATAFPVFPTVILNPI